MKKILILITNIIIMVMTPFLTLGGLWFTLEELKTTFIGEFILRYLTDTSIFWITISLAIFFGLLLVIKIILRNQLKAKLNNLFIHLSTYISCFIIIVLTGMTFYLVTPLTTNPIDITKAKKIGVAVILVMLVGFHILASKITPIIERKLTAYDTAIEMNTIGRGSVVFNNILKLVQLILPEILILILLCMITSWNIANYFVIVLVACLIPVLGNIISDLNTRAEIRINDKKKEEKLINDIAKKVKR